MARTGPCSDRKPGPRQGLRDSERGGKSQGHRHQATSKRKIWSGVACERG